MSKGPAEPLCDAPIIGANGNVYSVLGICCKSLKRAGFKTEAEELRQRVTGGEATSYDEALVLCMQYCNPTEAD